MPILLWIIFGAIAGWLASLLMKTNTQQGLLADIVIGVLGAMLGGFIFNLLGAPGVTGFNLYSVVVSVIGASVLLFLTRMVGR